VVAELTPTAAWLNRLAIRSCRAINRIRVTVSFTHQGFEFKLSKITQRWDYTIPLRAGIKAKVYPPLHADWQRLLEDYDTKRWLTQLREEWLLGEQQRIQQQLTTLTTLTATAELALNQLTYASAEGQWLIPDGESLIKGLTS
jgi:hypothetical protein